ncbi:hypothetical protein LXA43DRAFT_366824 [Ganoderma leucocontextum]|nr:hypothetical protein LXA43DRAFT_366824 [Ganoderma leucocontextum]
MKLRNHTPSVTHSWLITYLALALLVPAASTQTNFGFLQPLTDPIQRETYAFAWTGGTPPYQLQVSVSDNWGKAYGVFGLEGPGFPWIIPVPAGYAVSFELLDNANDVAAVGPLTIQPSINSSCFGPAGLTSSSTSSTTTSRTTTSRITTTSSSTEEPTTSSSMASSTDAKSSVTPTIESRSSHPPSPSSSVASDSVTSLTISPSSTSQASPTTDVTWSTTVTATIAAPTATIVGDRSPTSPHHATLSTGAVAGLAVAGAAVLVLAGITIWFCHRRKRRSGSGPETNVADSDKGTNLNLTDLWAWALTKH